MSWLIVDILAIQAFELAWLVILTAAWVVQRRRHDRLASRVGALSRSVTKVGRVRHTDSQPVPVVDPTRFYKPPPPLPVPLPGTNPITPRPGKHSAL